MGQIETKCTQIKKIQEKKLATSSNNNKYLWDLQNSLAKFYSLRIDGVKTGQGQSTNNYLQLYTIL